MSESLENLALAAFVFLPWTLVAVLRRTSAFWLPGAGLIALALYLFATITPDDSHGQPAVIGAGWGGPIAFIVLLYGLTCLGVAAWLYGRRPQPPAVELPTAIVTRAINDVSKT